jgi:hypothetical protein
MIRRSAFMFVVSAALLLFWSAAQSVASPRCFPAAVEPLESGATRSHDQYFAARNYATPDCGMYQPGKAASLYRALIRHLGWDLYARALWRLGALEPGLKAAADFPPDRVLFRIMALHALGKDDGRQADAVFERNFAPNPPPLEARALFEHEKSLGLNDGTRRLLDDVTATPLLAGPALTRCFTMNASRQFDDQVALGCAHLGDRFAEVVPFLEDRRTFMRATRDMINRLAGRRVGGALLLGAERHLESSGVKAIEKAYCWLLWAEDAGSDVEPLMSAVMGRLSEPEREKAWCSAKTDAMPPPL